MLISGDASGRRQAMKARQGSRIGEIFADGRQIDKALRLAARDAIRKHALQDAPLVIWPAGRIAWVSASELGAKTQRKTSRKGLQSAEPARPPARRGDNRETPCDIEKQVCARAPWR